MRRARAGLGLLAVVAASLLMVRSASMPRHSQALPDESAASELEAYRRSGDLSAQRRHVWSLFARLTDPGVGRTLPLFESWYGEDATFAVDTGEPTPGIRGFLRRDPEHPSADLPILAYTLYNPAAYQHIRRHQLYLAGELRRLSSSGAPDRSVAQERTVPAFPRGAMVMKTVWWPVARDVPTPLPLWSVRRGAPPSGTDDYTSWTRVVAVEPPHAAHASGSQPLQFAGQTYEMARRVALGSFYSVTLDTALARNLMRDRSAHKLALIVLGRELRAGDYVILVAVSLATKEIDDWVWGTLWWDDQTDTGPYAAQRPTALRSTWRHFLLQVAFDSDKPAAADGGPHVCFNPWMEGRFPDGGHGAGTVSNCMACHRRASYPPVDFLPVTRGAPDLAGDPAYAPGRLRTNFVWSIALHSRPSPEGPP